MRHLPASKLISRTPTIWNMCASKQLLGLTECSSITHTSHQTHHRKCIWWDVCVIDEHSVRPSNCFDAHIFQVVGVRDIDLLACKCLIVQSNENAATSFDISVFAVDSIRIIKKFCTQNI